MSKIEIKVKLIGYNKHARYPRIFQLVFTGRVMYLFLNSNMYSKTFKYDTRLNLSDSATESLNQFTEPNRLN